MHSALLSVRSIENDVMKISNINHIPINILPICYVIVTKGMHSVNLETKTVVQIENINQILVKKFRDAVSLIVFYFWCTYHDNSVCTKETR